MLERLSILHTIMKVPHNTCGVLVGIVGWMRASPFAVFAHEQCTTCFWINDLLGLTPRQRAFLALTFP
jgi:hypothetical protein